MLTALGVTLKNRSQYNSYDKFEEVHDLPQNQRVFPTALIRQYRCAPRRSDLRNNSSPIAGPAILIDAWLRSPGGRALITGYRN